MNDKNEKKRRAVNWAPILIVFVIVLFTMIIFVPQPSQPLTENAGFGFYRQFGIDPALPASTLTPLPQNYPNIPRDYFENQNETDGLILGGSIIVLMIVLTVFISRRNNAKSK